MELAHRVFQESIRNFSGWDFSSLGWELPLAIPFPTSSVIEPIDNSDLTN